MSSSAHSSNPPNLGHVPGGELPAADLRLVAPECRYEVEDGRVVYVPPADEPHGVKHAAVAAIVKAHARDGYEVAVDMLTRTSEMDDIAPDVSVFPLERHADGGRQLEELALEIVNTQRLNDAGRKASKLIGRGVRRVFAIDVTRQRVFEWSTELGTWAILGDAAEIVDRTLAAPLPVAALVRAVLTDDAVARALLVKENAVLQAALAARHAQGQVKGKADALLTVLSARGLSPTADQRARILSCESEAELERWLRVALRCQSMDELFDAR
ncbi:MAG TPA: Uma2 family endonuclease [Polyangiaceae bacterium]|nr:Uma2 family endonuclease [Polyangiaceae bacterium]